MNKTQSIQESVSSLTHEKRLELKEALTIAGLMHSNGKPTKLFFQSRRDSSTGRLKKIYSAFAKARKCDLDRSFDLFVGML